MFQAIRSHKFYVPLITVAVSVGLFLSYYLFYVARQRSDANERAFRLLSVVDGQVVNRHDTLRDIFAAALVDSTSEKPIPYITKQQEYLNRFLKNDDISDIKSTCYIEAKTPDGARIHDGELTLRLAGKRTQDFSLAATFQPAGRSCSLSATLDLSADLRKRFTSVTQDYFDDILIATSSGEVLFQQHVTGLRITNLAGVLPAKASAGKPADTNEAEKKRTTPAQADKPATEFQLASQFTNMKEVDLAGTKYKLYLQPVPVDIAGLDPKETKLKLVACGLWRSDRLESEVVSIPYTVLIWGTLVLLAAFALLWPLLKVAYMSPSERLRRRHVFYLLTSALLATALLTVIVLNASYTLRANEESKEQLEKLANQIDQNVRTELLRALALFDKLEKDEVPRKAFRSATSANWTTTNFLVTHPGSSLVYPYFDSIFWVDKEGRQQYKLAAEKATPAIGVQDKPYFQDVLRKHHLMNAEGIIRVDRSECRSQQPSSEPCPPAIRIPPELTGTLRDHKFRFDSIYSRNNGEFFLVLARPYQTPGSPNDLPTFLRDLKAEVLVSKFLSLVDPVVPSGFGFALVNHEGIAQVHSTAARSGIEDFFRECRQDPSLTTLVLNARSDDLQIDYMGKRQHMFVKPLPYLAEPAPALVVFRDMKYVSTINVACLLVFALLSGLFSLPFLVGLAVCVFRPRDYPLESLWPSRDAMSKYIDIMAANLCLTLAFAWRFSSMKMNETLISILVMTGIAAVFACLKPKWASEKWTLAGKAFVLAAIVVTARLGPALLAAGLYVVFSAPAVSRSLNGLANRFVMFKHAYVCMALSLLTVLVVLPSFGLYRISYNTVNRLALQNAQLDRQEQLTHRADDIRQRYLEPESAKRWEARDSEELDRYDRAVFNPTNAKQLPNHIAPDVSLLEWPIAWASSSFPMNKLGAELRETALAPRPGVEPHWDSARDEHQGDDELLWLIPHDAQEASLVGVYPLWKLNAQAAVLMAVLGIILVLWLQYVIRKVFLTDLEDAPRLEAWCPCQTGGRNLLIIGESDSGNDALLPAGTDADVLDLEQVTAAGNWTVPTLPAPTTRVDHFEFDLDNPETRLRKLQLLEQLRYVEKKHLILLSEVDPMFYLAARDAGTTASNGSNEGLPDPLLNRWVEVFGGFEKLQMQDVREDYFNRTLAEHKTNGITALVEMIEGECGHTPQLRKIGLRMLKPHYHEQAMSKEQFVEELLDQADTYYRGLWSTCTKEERLVLYQLALDGWVNPKNDRAIRQLHQRGIIRRGSGYRLMNDSLGRFVRNTQRAGEVAKWEEEEEHSTWSAMKLALGTALMMFGAWLLYAQQDIFQLGIGYLTALGTASGAILSLTRNLRGKGGAASSA